jgi:hypothetical protein
MSLVIRGQYPSNVFHLFGNDENSATFALGWVLDRCPVFLRVFTSHIAGRPLERSIGHLVLQKSGSDGGYTDIEIQYGQELHCIVEAKRGWALPNEIQLRRYRPRLNRSHIKARHQYMVSVSAASDEIARLRLPINIDSAPLVHLSWGLIRTLAIKSRMQTKVLAQRLWLSELATHLEEFSAMDALRDNMVYVVSLSSKAVRQSGTHTWIDVVEKDNAYFHPVGKSWPSQPPNYIAFRYGGELQSVHRIVAHEIWANVAEKNPKWCETKEEHFVYNLGPVMRPPRKLKAGGNGDSLRRATRVYCAIDTLLTGQFEFLGQAHDETKRRIREAETREGSFDRQTQSVRGRTR